MSSNGSRLISGVEVITIAVTEYAELLACKQRLAETTVATEQLFGMRRSLIDRNPEVAVFISQRLGLEPVSKILRRCRRRFGASRTPSQATTYRYWERLRKEASKRP